MKLNGARVLVAVATGAISAAAAGEVGLGLRTPIGPGAGVEPVVTELQHARTAARSDVPLHESHPAPRAEEMQGGGEA